MWLAAGLVFASGLLYSFYLIGRAEVIGKIGPLRFTAYAMMLECVLTLLKVLAGAPARGQY